MSEAHAFGAGAFGEAIDYANAQVYAGSREQQRDVTSTTGAQAAATAHLRQRQLDAPAGVLVVPPSCGLEPLDVIDVSDPLIAASAAKRRVASITWRYDVRRAIYEQQIELGAM